MPEVTIAQGAETDSRLASRERAPGTSVASVLCLMGIWPSAAHTSGMDGVSWVGL